MKTAEQATNDAIKERVLKEEALKAIKQVNGDIYELRMKDSVADKLEPEYRDLFRRLQELIKYLGKADR
jgi:hypothetical protein